MTDSIVSSDNAVYLVVALLLLASLLCLLMRRDRIRLCVAVNVLASAGNLLLLLWGYRDGNVLPAADDPLAQGGLPTFRFFVLLSILLSFSAFVLMLALVVLLGRHYGPAGSNGGERTQ